MFLYVHHVHYVVQNRDAMTAYIEKNFGMKPDRLSEKRKSKDALYDIGKTQLQITEPTDPASGQAKHLAKHGPGVFHVAWAVDDIENLAKNLAANGNKMKQRGDGVISRSSRENYLACDLDPSSSLGVWFQLIGANK